MTDRELQMQTFIRRASEVPGLSAELDQVTWERDQLRKTLADREDAIRRMQEELNELRNESDGLREGLEDVRSLRRIDDLSDVAKECDFYLSRALESKP